MNSKFLRTYQAVFWTLLLGGVLSVIGFIFVLEGEEKHNQENFEYRAQHHTVAVKQGFEHIFEHADQFASVVETELVVEEDKFSTAEFGKVAKRIVQKSIIHEILWFADSPLLPSESFAKQQRLLLPADLAQRQAPMRQHVLQVQTDHQPSLWLMPRLSGYDVYYMFPVLDGAREHVLGVAVFCWSLKESIEVSIGALPVSGQDISYWQKNAGADDVQLYTHVSRGKNATYSNTLKRDFYYEVPLQIQNQTWNVAYIASNVFFLEHPLQRVWDILLFGFIITLLIAAMVALLLRRTQVVEALVAQKTKALLESESRYQQMIEHMPVGIAVHKKGIIQYLNPFFLHAMGNKTLEEMIGESILKYVHPEDQAHVMADAQRAVDDDVDAQNVPVRYITPDADQKIYETLASCTRIMVDGEALAVTIALDITEQNKARRDFEDQHQTMQAILDASPIGIWMLDQNSHIKFLNSAFAKAINFDETALLAASHYRDVLSEKVAWQCLSSDEACLKKRGMHHSIEHFPDAQGKERIYEVIKVPLFQNQVDFVGIVGLCIDITERLEAETERERTQKMAEEAQRLESLGVLAGGIAHDFNNLLSVILGNAALASKRRGEDSGIDVYLSRIEHASTSAASLCNQMLAYAGQGKFEIRRLKLTDVVADMSQLLEVSLLKSVSIAYDLTEDIAEIEVDSAQLQQVIMNLITNANEAMEESGGVISIKTGEMVIDSALPNVVGNDDIALGDYVYVEVADQGCGMSEQMQGKIFEPFFTTKFTGRGLGMSAMLGIVRSDGGLIQLHSEEGKGTLLRVFLPKAAEEEGDVQTESGSADQVAKLTTAQPIDADIYSKKILIIDDEEVILETTDAMIQDIGFATLLAEDGVHGLALYQEHQDDICLVLMDMTMPRMDGQQCTEAILKLNTDAKVILCSGYSEEEAVDQFAQLAIVDFIQKPFHPDLLQKKVMQALGSGAS
ncbi:MAG: PAS domain S-box protein [Ghiorsea sp.]